MSISSISISNFHLFHLQKQTNCRKQWDYILSIVPMNTTEISEI